MKQAAAIFLVIVLCISFSGCDSLDTNIENLSGPPKLTEEQLKIYEAMNSTSLNSDNITLKYPQTGDFRSAIIITNIDDEPENEALIFYEKKTETETNIFMSVADQNDGEWIVKCRVPLNGTEVDKVSFFTDTSSGQPFILIGTADDSSSVGKTLQIFSYSLINDEEQGLIEPIDTYSYKMFEVYDINEDGQDEIILITQTEQVSENKSNDNPLITTNAVMLEYRGSFYQSQSVEVSDSVIEYVKITKNHCTFDTPALFIDELVSDYTYGTEILIFENRELKNLTYKTNSTALYEKTLRTQVPYCYDVMDNDEIEIPQTQYMKGYNSESTSPMYITTWNKLSGDEMEPVCTTYINYAQGYGIKLDDKWADSISAKLAVESDEVTFFIYKGNLDNDSDKLFSIKVDTSNNIQKNGAPDGYFEIKKTGQLVFLAKIYMNEYLDYEITEQYIKEGFIDLYTTEE